MTPQDDRPDDFEEPALVRPYAMVRGRTRGGEAGAALPMEAVVVSETGTSTATLLLERKAIVRLCARPHSLAEVAALLDLPVGVARVLVADLAEEGFVQVNLPLDRADGPVDRGLLERVLAGLEAL